MTANIPLINAEKDLGMGHHAVDYKLFFIANFLLIFAEILGAFWLQTERYHIILSITNPYMQDRSISSLFNLSTFQAILCN